MNPQALFSIYAYVLFALTVAITAFCAMKRRGVLDAIDNVFVALILGAFWPVFVLIAVYHHTNSTLG